jgi:hypothetical protein
VVGATVPTTVNFGFLDRSRYFLNSFNFFNCPHEAVTPFQTHYFTENPVAPGIEPGHLDM